MKLSNYFYIGIVLLLTSCGQKKNNNTIANQQLEQLKKTAYDYLKADKADLFIKTNQHYKNLAILKTDSLYIADADWNFALYYDGIEKNDSAYYYYHRSASIYSDLNEKLLEARQLYNKANMQKRFHDLTGAEINIYKALSLLATTDYKQRILNRNLLGIIYMQINDKDEAVEQFNHAISIIKESGENKELLKTIYNNLAILYQKGKNYDRAIDYFKLALQEVTYEDKESYSRYVTNLYFTQFLRNGYSKGVENELINALNIREDEGLKTNITDSYLKLSSLYLKKPDSVQALVYAKKALRSAKEINYFELELESYELLSKLDTSNDSYYFESYKSLKDSLEIVDRSIRNKFTRIEYETEQIKERADKLLVTNKYLTTSIFLFVLTFALVFYILLQRNKQKQLELTNQIELDKIEMYKLSVKSREKIEEGVSKERRRISMELHDGVLSSLASIRVSIAVLLKKIKKFGVQELINFNYEKEINKLENEIRSLSHDLHNQSIEMVDFLELLKDNIKSTKTLKVTIKQDKIIHWDSVEDFLKSNILRIVQETYKNTLKHSKATNFSVLFSLNDSRLTLKISDNGKGFNINQKNKGIGLSNIKSRVKEFLKGTLEINTTTDGTVFTITIPNIYDK